MEDYLEMIIDTASKYGARYSEARYQSDTYESILLKNGTPEMTTFDVRRGVAIRALVGGGLGFGATNIVTKRDLKTLVSRVLRLAKASSRIVKTPISMGEAEIGRGNVEVKSRIGFDAVSMESRIDLLKEADSAGVESAEAIGVKLPGRYISLDTLVTEKLLMTSDGARVQSTIPKVTVDAFLTAFEPQKGTVQRMFSLGESSGWESVEKWNLPERIKKEAQILGNILTSAKPMKGERLDVVLGPEVVGIISHESSGHPGEADRILGREAAQAGETYLGRDSIGMKVGSDVVNVVEDPTIPRSFGYYLYDDEGVKARRRYLIKQGRINEFLHNRETAHVFGVSSNASSRSVAYNREPIVRMANTFVEPGDHKFEELLEGIENGIYVKNFMEWNIDDRRFNQKYVGLEAYRIEKGQLKGLLRNPIIEITTTGLWSAVDAVGRDLEFSAASCGKGDPMQGIPVWTGGPHIRLRNVAIGGIS